MPRGRLAQLMCRFSLNLSRVALGTACAAMVRHHHCAWNASERVRRGKKSASNGKLRRSARKACSIWVLCAPKHQIGEDRHEYARETHSDSSATTFVVQCPSRL